MFSSNNKQLFSYALCVIILGSVCFQSAHVKAQTSSGNFETNYSAGYSQTVVDGKVVSETGARKITAITDVTEYQDIGSEKNALRTDYKVGWSQTFTNGVVVSETGTRTLTNLIIGQIKIITDGIVVYDSSVQPSPTPTATPTPTSQPKSSPTTNPTKTPQTPSETPDSKSSPSPTKTATPAPSITQTPSVKPQITPTPTIPELTPLALVLILIMVSIGLAFAKKQKH
jgi:hypothetical protein